MSFKSLKLSPELLKAVESAGYDQATPIQQKAIPIVLKNKDVLACAQTGTGKTAAFALPLLQILNKTRTQAGTPKSFRALVITPTRELALQIHENFKNYGSFTSIKSVVIFGGVSQNSQVAALKRGVDVIIATPGRLLDLINQKIVDPKDVKHLVLDEADRMLDMGFIHDINKILTKLSQNRQTLLFSATMPKEIEKLANKILRFPVRIAVTPVSSTVELIQQRVYPVAKEHKNKLLVHLLKQQYTQSTLVFSRTKHGANNLARKLYRSGVSSAAIHGDKSQNARQRALNDFKQGKIRVLVATDIAARGIDVDDLACVINFNLPDVPETYVHRIGRTGRAGSQGMAVSFCDPSEEKLLHSIEKLIHIRLEAVWDHPFNGESIPENLNMENREKQQRPQKSYNPPGRRRNRQSNSRRASFSREMVSQN